VDPVLARDIVNHLVSAYTQRTFMTRYDDTMKASDWLSGQMAQIKASAEKSEAKLSQLQKKTGIFGADENNNLVLSKLDDLSKELTDAEADRITKEAQYRVAQSGNPELLGTIAPDSVLPVLRGQQADLKNQLAQATSVYGADYPAVVQLRNQLAQVQKSLQKEITNIEGRFRSDYEISAAAEKQVKAAFDQQMQRANNMSSGLDQYGILKREVDADNDLYQDLTMKLKEAGVIASLKAVTVDPIDLARLPTSPVEPNIRLVLALSAIFGSCAGISFAFAAESLNTTIWSSEEFQSLVSLPLFGIIPHINLDRQTSSPTPGESGVKASMDPALTTLQRPRSQASEAFRGLRTSILLASAGTPPKVILITSAIPGEGKTTVSTNIAFTLNQGVHRVLLVDADLRRGTLAEKLNLPKNFGLTGALTGAGSWRDAVVTLSDVPQLSVLQTGLRPPNSAELVGATQMHDLLEEWKAEYDHVIIDTAPSLFVTDAVLLAQWVDMVLLVSRIGVTPRTGLRRACELLHTGKAKISGLIVNDMRGGDHYYGYGYGSGKGYYSEEET
jgi:capsular exopolysaccharide synthesis family protein